MPESTRTRAVPDSAECTGAKQLEWPEMHHRCAGNATLRIPGVHAPVLTYTCGCTCHAEAIR